MAFILKANIYFEGVEGETITRLVESYRKTPLKQILEYELRKQGIFQRVGTLMKTMWIYLNKFYTISLENGLVYQFAQVVQSLK